MIRPIPIATTRPARKGRAPTRDIIHALVKRYAGRVMPTQTAIGTTLGISQHSVHHALKSLQHAGLLRCHRRLNAAGNGWETFVDEVCDKPSHQEGGGS